MKKLLVSLSLVIASFACFAQSPIQLENASNCTVRVLLFEVTQGTCNSVTQTPYILSPGASIPATATTANGEFVHAEVTDLNGCFGVAIDTDGFPSCVTCPGFGAPTGAVIPTNCGTCQPQLTIKWDSNCGGLAHMHIY